MILNGKVINPGELNTQVTLKPRTVVQDAGGFYTPGQGTSIDVWVKWTNAHGAEAWNLQTLQVEQPATVLMRWLAGFDATWTVTKNGVVFEVATSPDDISERHEFIEFGVRRMQPG